MLFANLLDKITAFLDGRLWARIIYYALVVAALIAVAVCLRSAGVAFVYNEF